MSTAMISDGVENKALNCQYEHVEVIKQKKKKKDILGDRLTFKPMDYEWAYEAWLRSEQAHWLHTEIAMASDINDWKMHA